MSKALGRLPAGNAQMRAGEAILGASDAEAEHRVVLAYDGEICPYTRVLTGERSPRAGRYRDFRFLAGLDFRRQWGARPLLGKGLRIELDMVITVPARKLWTQDADNLGKGLMDSMIGVVLEDDRFVTAINVMKVPARAILGRQPGAIVQVAWWPLGVGDA